MSFTALSPNWQMTALFFLTVLLLCYLAKLVTFHSAPKSKDWAIILAPFPFTAASKRMLPLSAAPRLVRRFVAFLVACICAYWLYWQLLRDFRPPTILLSYLGALILWLVGEALGSLVPFLTMPSGRLLPLPHGATPPLAKSLSEFWGRRWNVWMSDWFRQIIFCPLQNSPVFAFVLVFLISGLLHELAINLPLYIVTGKKYFGSMVLYFLLQAVGILIERKTRNGTARIFLLWLFVFGAVPLIVNEGMLRILHLWPG
jgi:Membrane bound O-acyl transferase family